MKPDEAYYMIDRFLRNNLHDDDYAEYSEGLESLITPLHTEKDVQFILDVAYGPTEELERIVRLVLGVPKQ